jgi:uncharacterized protein
MKLAGAALERFIEGNIFFPDTVLSQEPSAVGLPFENVLFKTDDGIHLHGWLVPASSPGTIFLFCHGNAGNISHRIDNILRLHQIGLTVFIFDYRGYGRSGGQISERGFYLDVEAAYRIAKEIAQKEAAKLVIFGRSLGGVAAVHLAAYHACSGVILESAFTHLGAMAKQHFPLPFISKVLSKRLNAIDKIPRITAPILFFHGDQDDIVPHSQGEELFEAARAPKEFVTLEGAGHNDTYFVGGQAYFEKLGEFIASLT